MKKSCIVFLISAIIICFGPHSTVAQIEINKHHLGPTLGLSFLGSTFQIGANYEYGLDIKDFGNIGIGGILRYWSYSEAEWSYSDFLIGAQGNYYFKIQDKNIQPYAGITIAYDFGSWDYDFPKEYYWAEPSYGGLYFGFQGGARYWISSTIALNGRISYGNMSYGGLDIGVEFKF